MWSPQTSAGPLHPSRGDILQKVTDEAFEDFPRVNDILAIIHIESSFNPSAKNKTHRGLMQVHNGSLFWDKNIEQGVSILRQLYLSLGSREKAIRSYHLGIGNVLRNKLTKSGDTYYSKFRTQRRKYESNGDNKFGNDPGIRSSYAGIRPRSVGSVGPSNSGVQCKDEATGIDPFRRWFSEGGDIQAGSPTNLREDMEVVDAYYRSYSVDTFDYVPILLTGRNSDI